MEEKEVVYQGDPVHKGLFQAPEEFNIPTYMVKLLLTVGVVSIPVGEMFVGWYVWPIVVVVEGFLYMVLQLIHAKNPFLFLILHNRWVKVKYNWITYAIWRQDSYGTTPDHIG